MSCARSRLRSLPRKAVQQDHRRHVAPRRRQRRPVHSSARHDWGSAGSAWRPDRRAFGVDTRSLGQPPRRSGCPCAWTGAPASTLTRPAASNAWTSRGFMLSSDGFMLGSYRKRSDERGPCSISRCGILRCANYRGRPDSAQTQHAAAGPRRRQRSKQSMQAIEWQYLYGQRRLYHCPAGRPWYKARLSLSFQVQRFTPCRESAKSRAKAPKRAIRFPTRTIASGAVFCRICTPTASGPKCEKRFVSLRVSTRGLRTIEKRGVDVVVADLRAKGVKV